MGRPFLHETQLLTAAKNVQLQGPSLSHGTPHQYSLYLIKIETKDFLRSAIGIAISDSSADLRMPSPFGLNRATISLLGGLMGNL
jgi:hypothetical protein